MARLFDPLVVGKLKLKNRVVFAPCVVGLCDNEGYVTPRSIAHYAARAKGGVGLVIVEAATVEISGSATKKHMMISDDRYTAGLAKLAQAIKDNGARAAIQIGHAGAQALMEEPLSPSGVPAVGKSTIPRPMSHAEVKGFSHYYAEASRRAKEAGFDAVEIHGAHGYLINQFISPYYNKRTDEYGGSFENRMRFALEVIAACKKALGNDFPLLMRISADEWLDGGMRLPDSQESSRALVAAGVHIIDVSAGSADLNAPKRKGGEGWMLPLAEGIKQAVSAPVIAVGCISSPEFADKIVQENRTDLVALGRALLFDPEWANKAAEKLGVTVA